MKKFLLFIFLCLSCTNEGPTKSDIRDEVTQILLYQIGIPRYNEVIDTNVCRLYSKYPNILYFTNGYGFNFIQDKKEYEIIVIGDSTLDISHRYAGWYDKNKTQVVAVAGNTLCDMTEQTKSQNSTHPKYIIIGTTGGNDMERNLEEKQIYQNAILLYVKLREKYPNAKQIWIGIHPLMKGYLANKYKTKVNRTIQEAVLSSGHIFYDPRPLFGVCDTCNPNKSDMIDAIHYGPMISFKLKGVLEIIMRESL